MYPQHFLIEGRHLGTGIRKLERREDGYRVPLSLAFFCRACGELWAKCPVESSPGISSPWICYNVDCKKHQKPNSIAVPGSLILAWDDDFYEAFPEAVLRWELDRHLEAV
jgi:hypothetical protein